MILGGFEIYKNGTWEEINVQFSCHDDFQMTTGKFEIFRSTQNFDTTVYTL